MGRSRALDVGEKEGQRTIFWPPGPLPLRYDSSSSESGGGLGRGGMWNWCFFSAADVLKAATTGAAVVTRLRQPLRRQTQALALALRARRKGRRVSGGGGIACAGPSSVGCDSRFRGSSKLPR